jgi:hypothetical protein
LLIESDFTRILQIDNRRPVCYSKPQTCDHVAALNFKTIPTLTTISHAEKCLLDFYVEEVHGVSFRIQVCQRLDVEIQLNLHLRIMRKLHYFLMHIPSKVDVNDSISSLALFSPSLSSAHTPAQFSIAKITSFTDSPQAFHSNQLSKFMAQSLVKAFESSNKSFFVHQAFVGLSKTHALIETQAPLLKVFLISFPRLKDF